MSHAYPASIEANTFERELLAATPKLSRYALRLCGSLDNAEDLMQTTSLIALTRRERFQPGSGLTAWLKGIMRNVLRDERKSADCKMRRDAIRQSDFDDDEDGYDAFDGVAYPDRNDPERLMVAWEQYVAPLEKLEPRVAAMITDAGAGLSMKEIAAKFHVPINSVKSSIHRGRAQLLAITERAA